MCEQYGKTNISMANLRIKHISKSLNIRLIHDSKLALSLVPEELHPPKTREHNRICSLGMQAALVLLLQKQEVHI